MNPRDYFENLAKTHAVIRHGHDGKCHFSSLIEEAQNQFAQRMHYPCVVLSTGDFEGATPTTMDREVTLLFLDHCADTGDYGQIRRIFDTMEQVMRDFIARMLRDRARTVREVSRFALGQTEAHQVYLESAGLYGWALMTVMPDYINTKDCDHAFTDGQ